MRYRYISPLGGFVFLYPDVLVHTTSVSAKLVETILM
jgi:hypothetical protein